MTINLEHPEERATSLERAKAQKFAPALFYGGRATKKGDVLKLNSLTALF